MSQIDPVFFGAGTLTLIPPVTTAVPVPTPVQVGALQDVSVDITSSTKELHGSDQFPIAVAVGKGKITGKAKSAVLNGGVANAILAGGIVTAGRNVGAEEAGTVPGTPYEITVTNAADFIGDLGVVDLTAGKNLVKVDDSPATGEYAVSAGGVYTFAAADTGNSMIIRYTYSVDTGSTIIYSNQPMGHRTKFQVELYNEFEGDQSGIVLYAAVFSKLTFPFKNEDFAMNDLDFECFQDSQRRVIGIYTPTVIPPTV